MDAILLPSAASGSISIDGPTNVGEITCINSSVTSISSSTFHLSGNFTIQDNLALHTLNFSQLGQVSTLTLTTLPTLRLLIFSSSLNALAVEVINTAIESFPELVFSDSGGTIAFTNNTALNMFTFQGTFVNSMEFHGNFAANLSGIDVYCPHLLTAESLDLSECSDIYLPVLTTVNGNMLIQNNRISSFSAPSLTIVGQTLNIGANPNLTIVELPKLKTVVSYLYIYGSPLLSSLDFQALQSANIYVEGSFGRFVAVFNLICRQITDYRLDLPAFITGDITEVDSSGPFDCSSFVASVDAQANFRTPGVSATPGTTDIWFCVAQNVTYTGIATGTGIVSSTPLTIQTPSHSASTTPGPLPKAELSTGAKIGIGLGVPLGLILLAGLIFLFWKRRSVKQDTHPWQAELPQGGHHEKQELKGEGNHPVEVSTEEQPSELVVNHPLVELA